MRGQWSREHSLRVLGLDQRATEEDYRRAYKHLVEIWHPDRVAHNEDLRLLATNRLKEINEAYNHLVGQGTPSASAAAPDERSCVLCVDDDILALKGLQRQLSRSYAVVLATDAETALDVLVDHDEVAVVLSDLVMPRVDGIAFLRQVRVVSPHSTRILLTGHREAISMAVALDRKFLFKILEKPCADDLLFATVRRGVDLWRVCTLARSDEARVSIHSAPFPHRK